MKKFPQVTLSSTGTEMTHIKRAYVELKELLGKPITRMLEQTIHCKRDYFVSRLKADNLIDFIGSDYITEYKGNFSPYKWLFRMEVEKVLYCYDYVLDKIHRHFKEDNKHIYPKLVDYSEVFEGSDIERTIRLDSICSEKFMEYIEN